MTARKAKTIAVEQDPNDPVPKKMLAKEIVALSRAAKDLLATGLSDLDLIALLVRRGRSRFNATDAANVIEALRDLGRDYAKAA